MEPVPVDYYDARENYHSVPTRDLREAAHRYNLTPRRILDIGCGDGRIADAFPDALILGIDYSAVRIAKAQQRPGIWLRADLDAFLAVTDVTADLVTICEVLEHVDDPQALVAKARRIAGVLATVPVNMPDPAHVHVWATEDAMRADLHPDHVVRIGRRWMCWWDQA